MISVSGYLKIEEFLFRFERHCPLRNWRSTHPSQPPTLIFCQLFVA